MEQFIQLGGGHAHHSGFPADEFFLRHIQRHVQRGSTGTLAHAALEHIKGAVLNGEFNIQHILVMLFQFLADGGKFLVCLRQEFLHGLEVLVLLVLRFVVQGVGGTGTGNHVFALGIDEPFAVELVIAGGGVAGEGNARCGVVVHIAEDHALDVDSSSPVIRNIFDPAVGGGFFAVPAFEDGADAAPELFHGVVRKLPLEDLLDGLFEVGAEFFQVIDREIGVAGIAVFLLACFQLIVQQLADALAVFRLNAFRLFHYHVRIHHNEAAVCVIDKAFVGALDETGDRAGGETNVQDRFHHARHGAAGTGAAGDEQRIFGIAKVHAHGGFHLLEGSSDLFFQIGRIRAAVPEEISTTFRCDRKTGRDRQSHGRHLGKVRAFAAQQVLHGSIAIRHSLSEEVHILHRVFCRCSSLFCTLFHNFSFCVLFL